MDEDGKIAIKDIPVYHWATKEEGKEQYAKFAKEFLATIKSLRFILEDGGIERFLGRIPGNRPVNAAERSEWLQRTIQFETKTDKLEMHCANALGVLEKSFPYGTTPRNILDKAAETPAGVEARDWTYRRSFLACWEALKNEYQPSTSVDLKQLRDQIYKLTDEGPGGFEHFKSEFHRLHAEIVATGVNEAVTNRELNEIVRDGIKNKFVWVNICYNLYRDNPNTGWQNTFDAVSTALTSFRQKGFDPYTQANSGPIVNANSALVNSTMTSSHQLTGSKRPFKNNHDNSGKAQKQQRTHPPGREVKSSAPPSNADSRKDQAPKKCTRCWQVDSHSYRFCTESKCACGASLAPGQVVCFNYESHPATMKFINKMPRFIETALQSAKQLKGGQRTQNSGANSRGKGGRFEGTRRVSVMSAQSINEQVKSGPPDETLDEWD